VIRSDATFWGYLGDPSRGSRGAQRDLDKALGVLRNTIAAYAYLALPEITQIWVRQRDRVADTFAAIEAELVAENKGWVNMNLGTMWKTWTSNQWALVGELTNP